MTKTNPDRVSHTGPHRDRAGARITLLLAAAGFFLITLDILIVNVALTRIDHELGGGTVGQQWVVDGYTLLFASLLLFAGNLADRIGAKRAFNIGEVNRDPERVQPVVAPPRTRRPRRLCRARHRIRSLQPPRQGLPHGHR